MRASRCRTSSAWDASSLARRRRVSMALNRAVEINHGRGLPGTPLLGQRSRKGFVHRLLGKIKITEQADQSCQDSSRIHAIKGVEQISYLLGGTLGHDDDLNKPATPNQFDKRRIVAGGAMQSAQVVTLKSGQQNASSVDSKSPMHSFELRTSSTLPRCSRVTSYSYLTG